VWLLVRCSIDCGRITTAEFCEACDGADVSLGWVASVEPYWWRTMCAAWPTIEVFGPIAVASERALVTIRCRALDGPIHRNELACEIAYERKRR